MSAFNTVVLIPDGLSEFHDERVANTGITAGQFKPGMLAAMVAGGKVKPHAVAGGGGPVLIVKEDEFRGMTVDGDLFADGVNAGGAGVGYVAGDQVMLHRAQKGDKVQMILAAAQTATEATPLASNGDGTLKVANGTTDVNLFIPDESVTTTGATGKIACFVL